LSGSPCSVRDENAPNLDLTPYQGKVPVLGVCYGAQLLVHQNNGVVTPSEIREYGRARLEKMDQHYDLLKEMTLGNQVWMSHGDTISKLPSSFTNIASTADVANAAFKLNGEETYGIQFHPEVTHSDEGKTLLRNFVVHICDCTQDWTPDIFVENKRKAIGKTFIDIFDEESHKIQDVKWLAQGTIYPDVIESVSVNGPSATIKSHHNVGGLPEKMNLKVVEPLNTLFKDEVRRVGRTLEIPDNILNRHPFPGPGLGIRIIGEVTAEKVRILQNVDYIFINGLKE
ncbi:UNVERIFIED_CONTAM: hypothetical protein GTU68_056778, partial [Idotea baltica]|nr:hypothetical protein [Idotea baltica]